MREIANLKHTAPCISEQAGDLSRPLWSVMIPTFNCAKFLSQTIKSVLAQDPGTDQMQIEVVDDCSNADDPEAVVREIGDGRVTFFRKAKNGGAIANFNTCVERARGRWVHILHGDDFLLAGFYKSLNHLADLYPDAGLLATRSFFVDEEGEITAVSPRLKELETFSNDASAFYYRNPIQTPSVVVKRSVYEQHGGFLTELIHAADCEMWSRVISLAGGVVTRDPLACYRVFSSNDSGRLARSGENVRDLVRLANVLKARHTDFNRKRVVTRASKLAWKQAQGFKSSGQVDAAGSNFHVWREITPVLDRARFWTTLLISKHLRS